MEQCHAKFSFVAPNGRQTLQARCPFFTEGHLQERGKRKKDLTETESHLLQSEFKTTCQQDLGECLVAQIYHGRQRLGGWSKG